MTVPFARVARVALVEFLAARGEPAYRADQIEEAVYVRRTASFREISNLPTRLREDLAAAFSLDRPRIADRVRADDGTEKVVVAFADGARVEAVRMPRGDRLTLCLSTQVGCRFRCAFCATGLMGLGRNLGGGEIVEQFLAVAGLSPDVRPTNVVFMGMGEPLDNLDALLEALRLMTDPKRLGLGRDRITVSTVGIVPAIDRLAADGPGVRLAISLNAADDRTRTDLMPVNRRWPIAEVVAAGLRYAERARARVSFEYVLLGGVNDRPEDAQALVRLLGRAKVRLNVIPWNPVDGMAFAASNRLEAFVEYLRPRIYAVTVRRSQGREIKAACGQLVLDPAA
jgi:23S rRNA (adenine2503-C2)-methyltransferase